MKNIAKFPGFTLIEMLVVLGIIAIVVGTLLVSLNPIDQLRKSNDGERKSDLAQIQRALELYYQDNGRYPASSVDFKIVNNATTVQWGAAWQPYIAVLPKDPIATRTYEYYSPVSANGQTYYLYASLERGSRDASACNAGNACLSITTGGAGFPSTTACGSTCNYGATSPNVSP